MPVKKNIGEFIESKNIEKYKNLMVGFILSMELFDINVNETSNVYDDVIYAIKNNDWELQNPENFKNAYIKSKHIKMLSDYTIDDLNKMKLFKLKGFDIGYALKYKYNSYSEIVCVFNNEPNIKNIGDALIKSAISNGGRYLDHFDSYKLSEYYSKNGFVEYKRDSYDPKYDEDGVFRNTYGELDIVYREYKGE